MLGFLAKLYHFSKENAIYKLNIIYNNNVSI